MTDVNAILAQQLAEAIAQNDRPRQVALAASMIKERGADVPRLQQVITEAAAVLVREHQENDLEAAAQWAQTWHRHTRQPAIKDLWMELQERVDTLKGGEERVRAALAAGDTGFLRTAINDLECETGRLTSTAPLLAEAKRALEATQSAVRRKLTDRLARTEVMRRQPSWPTSPAPSTRPRPCSPPCSSSIPPPATIPRSSISGSASPACMPCMASSRLRWRRRRCRCWSAPTRPCADPRTASAPARACSKRRQPSSGGAASSSPPRSAPAPRPISAWSTSRCPPSRRC